MSLRTTIANMIFGKPEVPIPASKPTFHNGGPLVFGDDIRETLRRANERTVTRASAQRFVEPAGENGEFAVRFDGRLSPEAEAIFEQSVGRSLEPGEAHVPDGHNPPGSPPSGGSLGRRLEPREAVETTFKNPLVRDSELARQTRAAASGDGARVIRKTPLMSAPYGRRNFLIFINGDPRSGKDTTSALIVNAFEDRGFKAEMHSSIEPVRQMLLSAGIDVSAKNEKDRKLLAEIGDLTEDYNGFRSNYCVERFLKLEKEDFAAGGKGVALILHTREPATIHKISFMCRHVSNLRAETLFIAGRGEPVSSNKADAGVRGMTYDTTIVNDGSPHDLDAKCVRYVEALLDR